MARFGYLSEINPEDFFTGHEKSILRNPLIAETMYKCKDIERWGSGIKRIHDECVVAGIRVEFKRIKTGFVVAFYRPKWEEGKGLVGGDQKSKVKSRVKVIEIITQNPSVTIPEIAAALNMSIPGIEKIIRSLKKEKRLRRIGPDKGGIGKFYRAKSRGKTRVKTRGKPELKPELKLKFC